MRLPRHLPDRAEALLPLALSTPEPATLPTVTRSDILRLYLLRGIEALEAQYEETVDQEPAEEAARRLSEPSEQGGVPLQEMLGRHKL